MAQASTHPSYRSTTGRESGSTGYVLLLASVAALGGLLFGYDTAVIAGAIGFLREKFALTAFWEGFAAACALAGCGLGASLAGFLSDRLGRKKVLVLSALAFFISALGTALPRNFTQFIIFRFIGGIGIGAASITSPMYIAEITPFRIRGRMVSVNQFAIVSGMLIVYFVNYFIAAYGVAYDRKAGLAPTAAVEQVAAEPAATAPVAAAQPGAPARSWNAEYGWRWMFGSGVLPSVLFLGLLFLVPESPRWLTKQGREAEAARVLGRASGAADAQRQMVEIREALAEEKEAAIGVSWWWFVLGAVVMGALVASWLGGPWRGEQVTAVVVSVLLGGMLGITFAWLARLSFDSPFRMAAGIGVALAILQQVTGVNVFLYFAPEIFKGLGAGADTAMMQTVVVGAVNMAFTVLAIGVVDRVGRRPLMILGAVGMGVSLTALGLAAYWQSVQWWALIFMLGYIACFAVSVGPVTWVILSEIFPTSIRGRAMGSATICLWLANFLVSQTFPMMDQNPALVARFHHGFPFWVYAAFCVVLVLVVWLRVPETKGKTLEEIERAWLHRFQRG